MRVNGVKKKRVIFGKAAVDVVQAKGFKVEQDGREGDKVVKGQSRLLAAIQAVKP